MSKQRALMYWSGGKDSALALYHSLRSGQWDVQGLLTAMNELPQRISRHGGRTTLVHSFVFDGPIFSSPVPFIRGEIVRRTYASSNNKNSPADEPNTQWDTGFWYLDLLQY